MPLQTSSDPVQPSPNRSENLIGSSRGRRVVAVLRLAMALLVVAAITTQIIDESLHDAFVPAEYFSYFTIQSALMVAVVLGVAALVGLRHETDSELLASVRLAVLCYAVVTGVVYAVLLRGVPTDGYPGIPWPNEALHVWAPLFVAADWLLAPGRTRPAWSRLWSALIFPLAWLAFTLVRGGITGWYPYPFLDPASPAGWTGVLLHILAIATFIAAVAATGIALRGRSKASIKTCP